MPKASNPDPAERVRIAERRQKAIELRNAGVTYERIATQLGYAGRAQVYTDIQRARKQVNKQISEGLDVLREQELDRYDRLQAAHWSAALQGDEKAANTVLRVFERRAKLLGLDAPKDLHIQLERRNEMEASLVTEAVLAAFDAAGIPPELRMIALEAASQRLAQVDDIGQSVIAGEIIESGETE